MTCETCKNCRFWDQIPDDVTAGECHFHAPPPIFDPESDGEGYLVSWPVTAYDARACGHFDSARLADDQGEDDRA